MTNNKDYYKILGIDKNASANEIKKAFKSMAKKYHPDINKSPDAEQKFKEINDAYSVLSDKDKKYNYDNYGDEKGPTSNGFGFNGEAPFGGDDIFAQMYNDISGRFSNQRRENIPKGTDIKITLSLSLADIYDGIEKKIKIKKKVKCHRCHGTGSEDNIEHICPACNGLGKKIRTINMGMMGVQQTISVCENCEGTGKVIEHPCTHCHGSGLEEDYVEVKFSIPAGIPQDAYFKVKEKGNESKDKKGINGDLLVYIIELPNEKGLKRTEENNIVYTLNVNIEELIKGCTKEIPLIKGYYKINIPEGTQSNVTMKLANKGMIMPSGYNMKAYGDYLLKIKCVLPKYSTLTKEQKEALSILCK